MSEYSFPFHSVIATEANKGYCCHWSLSVLGRVLLSAVVETLSVCTLLDEGGCWFLIFQS